MQKKFGTLLPVKLRVSLIHNKQRERNAYLVPVLEQMCADLGASHTLLCWQPPVVPHSSAMRLWRDWRYYMLQLAWSRYRGCGLDEALAISGTFVFRTLSKHLMVADRERMCRISRIETLVTAKHIAAWRSFLESDATHLLCCEDDLVVKPDSVDRLRRLLSSPDLKAGLRYIDLAGGLPLPVLGLDRLPVTRVNDKIIYDRAVTNTACCYLVSRDLAERFMAQLLDAPSLRLVGIDWMMNAMLMGLRAQRIECDAVHFDPPIFGHGTFTGDYVSWMRIALETDTKPTGSAVL